jgi:serine protease Do
MATPRIHIQHEQFPGIPTKALEFFHPRNAETKGGTLRPKTVFDFAMHLAQPTGENTSNFPKFHRLNMILKRMADLNLLMVMNRGGTDSMDASYFCHLNEDEVASILSTIDFAVYGFPVIYKELSPAVVPIVHFNKEDTPAIGTAFLRASQLILTAEHCLAGAKSLSIRGVSETEFRSATVMVHNNRALDLAAIHFPKSVLEGTQPIDLGLGRVLDEVLVMGYPNVPGFTEFLAAEQAAISARITVTKGAVASEAVDMFAKTPLFLITARVRGGFSGGPVLGALGTAIGIVARQPEAEPADRSDLYAQYDNLGYGVAIPTEEIIKFLTACSEGGGNVASRLDTTSIGYREL